MRRLRSPTDVGKALKVEARYHPAHPADPLVDRIGLQDRVLHGVKHGWLAADWDDESKRIVRWCLTPEGEAFADRLARDEADLAKRTEHFAFWRELVEDPTK
jgi:hypothetical protein